MGGWGGHVALGHRDTRHGHRHHVRHGVRTGVTTRSSRRGLLQFRRTGAGKSGVATLRLTGLSERGLVLLQRKIFSKWTKNISTIQTSMRMNGRQFKMKCLRRQIKLTYLNFWKNEIEFPILFRLLIGIQRTGLDEIFHQFTLFSGTKLSSLGLWVHPLSLVTQA